MTRCATTSEVGSAPWRCGHSLSSESYDRLLRRAIFDCCQWHTPVDGRPALCPFPLLIEPGTWDQLAGWAEELAREALQAELELRQRPDLHGELGLPRVLRRLLRPRARTSEAGAEPRVIRFDFHWTTDGWCISEANTDVAGGYIEASGAARLMAPHYPGCHPAGDPAGALAVALAQRVGRGGKVGLMHLSVYVDDRQIMHYLAGRLAEQGVLPVLMDPTQLAWQRHAAWSTGAPEAGPLDLIFRFFPAEWLPLLPRRTDWPRLLDDGPTLVCNPVRAVLSQSKRFPLVWDRLATTLPTWRALLPQTQPPQHIAPAELDRWVLKPALGHEGQNIGIVGVTEADDWRRIHRRTWWRPRAWAAQRRFTPVGLATPEGLLYPCLGVYVIDGKAVGAYGRLARRPLIDNRSREVIVLLAPSTRDHVGEPRGNL